MELGLEGKTVIVTGAGSNIGRAIALTFAGHKANVAIAEWDAVGGQRVLNEIKALGAQAILVQTDVTKWDQVQRMVQTTLDKFKRVDVLVNNAGWAVDRLFVEKPRDEWEKEIAINYWGPINCIRAVLDVMIAQKSGKIVSLGSDAGRMGEYKEAVYAGAKGGTIALSKAIAREVGRHNINVNVVCPGLTVPYGPETVGERSMWKGIEDGALWTEEALERAKRMYPLRRLGKPQDVANAVVFLASDAASFITGQTLSVSGGYTMM